MPRLAPLVRMDPRTLLIVALAGLLLWQSAAGTTPPSAPDGGGGDADRGLIAVTGPYGGGASALYVIDTRTRHMAVYRLANGRRIEMVAARDCMYDFLLESYNDASAEWVAPAALRKRWQKFQKDGVIPAGPPEEGSRPEVPDSKSGPPPAEEGGR